MLAAFMLTRTRITTYTLITIQLLDYGVSMKTDDAWFARSKLNKLLQLMVLLCQGRSNTYVQSVLMSLMLQAYQQDEVLPHDKMLDASMSMINEEAGEISFSILSRACLGDTTKKKVDHMSELYRSLHSLRGLDDDFRAEFESNHGRKNWRRRFGPDDETVQQVGAFMVAMVRTVKAKQFTQYDGTLAGFKNRSAAAQHQVPFDRVTCRWMNEAEMKVALDLQFSKCDKFVNTSWGFERSEVLPEMAPNLAEDYIPLPREGDYEVTDIIEISSSESYGFVSENSVDLTGAHVVPLKPGTNKKPRGEASPERGERGRNKKAPPPAPSTDESDSSSSRSCAASSAVSAPPWQRQSWANVGNVDESLILDKGKTRRRKQPTGFRAGDASSPPASDWTSADDEGYRESLKDREKRTKRHGDSKTAVKKPTRKRAKQKIIKKK